MDSFRDNAHYVIQGKGSENVFRHIIRKCVGNILRPELSRYDNIHLISNKAMMLTFTFLILNKA